MAAIPPTFTVTQAMIACGVNPDDQFGGRSAPERIAADLFNDNYLTCMDKTFEELDTEFKAYSELTQNQGQIRLLPGIK